MHEEPIPPKAETVERPSRHRVYYSAFLRLRDLSLRCRVRDISASGALVETTVPLWSGAECALEMPRIGQTKANVVWVDSRHCGLRFDPVLDPSALSSLLDTQTVPRVPTHVSGMARRRLQGTSQISQERARNAVNWLRQKAQE